MRPINVVLLEEPVALDVPAIAQAIRNRYPNVPVDVITGEEKGLGSKELPLLRCDNEFVVVMNKTAPVRRDEEVDAVWNHAAIAWPQSIEARDRHRAHIVVSTLAEGKPPLKEARVLTAVIGGLLDIVPQCSAVMWGPRVARSAADWKDQSRAAFAAFPDFPFPLWIDVLPAKTDSGLEVITVGLSSFVGREIEFEVGHYALPAALTNVASFAAYLIENGDVVKDGDTFGGSEGERIAVRHAISRWIPDTQVLRIPAPQTATNARFEAAGAFVRRVLKGAGFAGFRRRSP